MSEPIGNLELFIRKEVPPYSSNNVKILLTSLQRSRVMYKSESADTINPRHHVKFENIPLGHYKLESFCEGYLNKSEFVHVKFPGADTHWQGHFRRSRNRKTIDIKRKSNGALSKKGIDLLKSIEGLAVNPYDDQTGKTITNWVKGATIGYGHLISKEEWSKYKNSITESQAIMLFKSDLAPFEQKVKSLANVPLSQHQFDALVMLSYNIGVSAFTSSTVLKLINNRSISTHNSNLEKAWMAWNKSQGKPMKGLTNRRHAEWKIFSQNIYQRW